MKVLDTRKNKNLLPLEFLISFLNSGNERLFSYVYFHVIVAMVLFCRP